MHKQPNSRHCFVCGVENPLGLKLEFYYDDEGRVTCEYVVGDCYQGYPGVTHGGIVASMIDEVLGRVHMGSDMENPRFMYTAKLTVNYRKPVPTGKTIKLVGESVKSKRRTALSKAEIYGPEGDLLVDAEAILIDVPQEIINESDLEVLGWRIYPDELE